MRLEGSTVTATEVRDTIFRIILTFVRALENSCLSNVSASRPGPYTKAVLHMTSDVFVDRRFIVRVRAAQVLKRIHGARNNIAKVYLFTARRWAAAPPSSSSCLPNGTQKLLFDGGSPNNDRALLLYYSDPRKPSRSAVSVPMCIYIAGDKLVCGYTRHRRDRLVFIYTYCRARPRVLRCQQYSTITGTRRVRLLFAR